VAKSITQQPGACTPNTTIALCRNSSRPVSGVENVGSLGSRVYAGKPLGELADTVREVVAKEFRQTPVTILLAFSLDK
jgi:hypothetical protein